MTSRSFFVDSLILGTGNGVSRDEKRRRPHPVPPFWGIKLPTVATPGGDNNDVGIFYPFDLPTLSSRRPMTMTRDDDVTARQIGDFRPPPPPPPPPPMVGAVHHPEIGVVGLRLPLPLSYSCSFCLPSCSGNPSGKEGCEVPELPSLIGLRKEHSANDGTPSKGQGHGHGQGRMMLKNTKEEPLSVQSKTDNVTSQDLKINTKGWQLRHETITITQRLK